MKTKRSRTIPGLSGKSSMIRTGVTAYTHNSYVETVYDGTTTIPGTQVTESEGHPYRSIRSGRNTDDIGGEFLTTKRTISGFRDSIHLTRPVVTGPGGAAFTEVYVGPITATTPYQSGSSGPAFPPASPSTDQVLDQLGATAIARCAPGSPPVNAVTFLSELYKDGLPSLVGASGWKPKTELGKSLGSEYLNLQFGWTPMLKDISSLANSVIKADSVLAQYERDAGKVVRRRYQFPVQRTVTSSIVSTNSQAYTPGISFRWENEPNGTLTRTRETEIRRWFSGAFTYHLPVGYESRHGMISAASKAKLLLGLDLTPETLWELAPWSWAIDWFTNTGDVIKNLSRFASGGLIMRYGYMMEHTIVTDTYSRSGPSGVSPQVKTVPNLVMTTEVKRRRRANPFGFGVSWNGLSPFQLSILAALGITKKP